jgi:fructose-1,6-bisphosphatase-3
MSTTHHTLPYLQLLSKQYPTIQAASTRIVNLTAILTLPKGTEHFLSDIHGEYEAFQHVLRNGSGSIRRKIWETFPILSEAEKKSLATLIYYPQEKLALCLKEVDNEIPWYRATLLRLIRLGRVMTAKYTRAKVRRFLPDHFTEIIEDLLHQDESISDKAAYYRQMIDSLIHTGSAREFVITMAELIQRLSIARLHIIGDVYDRGPGAHLIMDALMDHHSVDIQWGNHDIVWMGAAAGSEACMANVIRVCLRYANSGNSGEWLCHQPDAADFLCP